MDRINLISGYEPVLVRESITKILRDKGNEFRELADVLKVPRGSEDWEIIILKFCLDFEDCLNIWTSSEEPNSVKNTKCMTIMRELARGKNNLKDVIHLQNIAYTIFKEFHETYKRLS